MQECFSVSTIPGLTQRHSKFPNLKNGTVKISVQSMTQTQVQQLSIVHPFLENSMHTWQVTENLGLWCEFFI